jgi:hypothetical protein
MMPSVCSGFIYGKPTRLLHHRAVPPPRRMHLVVHHLAVAVAFDAQEPTREGRQRLLQSLGGRGEGSVP